jgi:hypothetical protein
MGNDGRHPHYHTRNMDHFWKVDNIIIFSIKKGRHWTGGGGTPSDDIVPVESMGLLVLSVLHLVKGSRERTVHNRDGRNVQERWVRKWTRLKMMRLIDADRCIMIGMPVTDL